MRSRREIQADAKTVKRERVVRWLAREMQTFTREAERSGTPTAIAKAAVCAELLNDFVHGRES